MELLRRYLFASIEIRTIEESVSPEGWAVKINHCPLTELTPSPAYEMISRRMKGTGNGLTTLLKCFRPTRALRVIKEERRQAVLNVICTHP